jgi:hypothetical protein
LERLGGERENPQSVIVPNDDDDDDDDDIVPLISRHLADNIRFFPGVKTRTTTLKQMTEGVKIRYT